MGEAFSGVQSKKVNHHLINFATELWGDLKGKRIFVPLCGKSIDMKWLMDQD